jgi:predicted DsbA family dithiol-disulfide isomerase
MIVDAVYDFLCPWCFVAKRHFDLAVTQERPERMTVRWRQFMLYPHFDRGGHDFLEFFRSKYGETLRVPMWDRIRAVAQPIGINFAFEKMTRGPASLDGHRLARWAEAQQPGVAPRLIERISSGFYEQARVIDNDFLVEAAAMERLDPVAARAHLESDLDLEAPFRETEEWRAQGVTSMPHYILRFSDGHEEVVRETSVEVFADAFRRERASQSVAA